MGNIRCAGMCALWRWSPETQKETRHTARLLLWKNGMVKYSQRSHNAVGDVQFFQISNVFSAQADVQRTGRVIQVAGLRAPMMGEVTPRANCHASEICVIVAACFWASSWTRNTMP